MHAHTVTATCSLLLTWSSGCVVTQFTLALGQDCQVAGAAPCQADQAAAGAGRGGQKAARRAAAPQDEGALRPHRRKGGIENWAWQGWGCGWLGAASNGCSSQPCLGVALVTVLLSMVCAAVHAPTYLRQRKKHCNQREPWAWIHVACRTHMRGFLFSNKCAVRALLPFCMACSLLPLLPLPTCPPPPNHPPTTSITRCADAQGGQPHEL